MLKDGLFFVVGSGISTGCFLQSENQSISTNVDWEMIFFPGSFCYRKTEKRRGGNASLTWSGLPLFILVGFLVKNKKQEGGKEEGDGDVRGEA